MSQKVNFKNIEGSILSAQLEIPNKKPRYYALFAHCFSCSKDLFASKIITKKLARLDIAVLRFDFTGLGKSEGDFSETNFSSNLEDLKSAYQYLEEHFEAPKLLIGHSLGGAAVLAAAKELKKVEAIATIGAPSNASHVQHLFDNKKEELEKKGEATVNLGGRDFIIKKQFVDNLNQYNFNTIIPNLTQALLILHSPTDNIVSIEEAQKIYTQAKHPKSFISLDKADHLLSKNEDAEYVSEIISSWCKRYIKEEIKEVTSSSEVIIYGNGGPCCINSHEAVRCLA